jgi:hypothetical protein
MVLDKDKLKADIAKLRESGPEPRNTKAHAIMELADELAAMRAEGWTYRAMAAALQKLGHEVSRATIQMVLREHAKEHGKPVKAPRRKSGSTVAKAAAKPEADAPVMAAAPVPAAPAIEPAPRKVEPPKAAPAAVKETPAPAPKNVAADMTPPVIRPRTIRDDA